MTAQDYEEDERITREWLATVAHKEAFVWSIPGTRFFLYRTKGGLHDGRWSFSESTADDELTYCYVETRSECRRMIDLLRSIDSTTSHQG